MIIDLNNSLFLELCLHFYGQTFTDLLTGLLISYLSSFTEYDHKSFVLISCCKKTAWTWSQDK